MDQPASGSPIPRHVGLILDGNRRWAQSRGVPSTKGHLEGYETLRTILRHAFKRGVYCVSVYGFSTENWSRSNKEVAYLMDLFVRGARKAADEFGREGIRVVVLGSRDRLSARVISTIEKIEADTKGGERGVLAICFNYGGRQEIADAAEAMMRAGILPDAVTPEVMGRYMYHPEVPPLDLIIRSSGEQRLSGFMLWRSEYAELFFTDILWPDFGAVDFDMALDWYAGRKRRFGG